MEMTIEESLNNLIELQKDYQQFHDDVWQDPKAYGITAESLRIGIEIMRKYQKIKEIINNTDYIEEDVIRYKMICEVIEDDIS